MRLAQYRLDLISDGSARAEEGSIERQGTKRHVDPLKAAHAQKSSCPGGENILSFRGWWPVVPQSFGVLGTHF